jgi:PhzF family phenazine biosynthesis protein
MSFRLYQVDAFTSQPFGGNPAAVCLLPEGSPLAVDARWMQAVAAEMNLSETAFLEPREQGLSLRWFTPQTEVDLCGHGTLASAHVLFEEGLLSPGQQALFHTHSGLLRAALEQQRGAEGRWIRLDFPSEAPGPAGPPPGLLEALGLKQADVGYVGRNRFDYLVEVASEVLLRGLDPDFQRLRSLGDRGVMVTTRGRSDPYDFLSRFFAPGVGIDEDPVTGSAHCCLGPYWGERLGKSELLAFQASRRGGVVKVRLAGGRVLLSGQAVTIFRGELR